MTLSGSHNQGDAGHVTDHNLIDTALNAAPTTYATKGAHDRPMSYTATSRVGTNAEVFIAKTDGTEAIQLTNDATYNSFWARWSPDGRRLLFLRTPAALINYDSDFTQTSLWVMNADGTGITRLVAAGTLGGGPGGYLFTPNWHPNGRDIYCGGGTTNTTIFKIRDDGTATVVPVTGVTTGVADVMPSPDGSAIAFTYLKNIWITAIGGGAKTQITTNGASEQHYDPCWSPDGSTLSFETQKSASGGFGGAGQWAIETCPVVNGATITTITDTISVYARPPWGPDGYLYVHAIRLGDTNFNIYKVRADGATTPIRLSDNSGRFYTPDVFVPRSPMLWRGNGSNSFITAFNLTIPQVITTGGVLAVGGVNTGNTVTLGPSTYGGSGVPDPALGSNGDTYNRSDLPSQPNLRQYIKNAGAWQTQSAVASTTATTQVVSNTLTETVVATYTIPANTPYVGAVTRLRAAGNSDLASGTTTIRVRIGGLAGTILFSVALAAVASAQPWWLDSDLMCTAIGGSGTVNLGGFFRSNNGSTMAGIDSTPTTVDTTANQAYVITVQHSVAAAGNTARLHHASYEAV